MKTGKVATEKIIHAGLTAARAITKGKGKVKFGMKWLINRVKGGYLFGKRVAPRADENQMPARGRAGVSQSVWRKGDPEDGGLRSRRAVAGGGREADQSRGQEGRDPPQGCICTKRSDNILNL